MICFSVVVPVFEHWPVVPHLMAALAAQTYPEPFDVILVDNGSPHFAPPSGLPANVTILSCEQPGSYAARNVGAAAARGNVLAFTDADCRPVPDWLATMAQAMDQNPDADLIAGGIEMFAASGKANTFEMLDTVSSISQDKFVGRGTAITANLSVRRGCFETVGGFDAARFSGGDVDFCTRAVNTGFRLVHARNAMIRHPARSTWGELETRARRLIGGQLHGGGRLKGGAVAMLRRHAGVAKRVLRQRQHPLTQRLVGIGLVLRLLLVEQQEAARIRKGGAPERR